ncbi:MAG: ammonium transporter [Candidatus Poribacteria bacterium]|nr:ammonium transporter [Candidatus Poribacteria bacterium]
MPTETAEAQADEGSDAAAALDSGDTAWMLTSSALVMLMLPGLALFYAGMVRRKNVLSSMIHSFAALGVIGALWAVVGYSLAFGSTLGGFIGNPLDKIFLLSVDYKDLAPDSAYPELVFMAFQGMFAIITPALISGAIAERVKFGVYIWFIALWSLLVYCPLAHWVWGGGWLASLDTSPLDFAGGTVVHLSSGISALIVVLIIGTRRGWPSGEMLPHNLTLTLLGAGLLWFGWFGFNAGSAVAANADAGLAFTTTQIAAACGALGWLIIERIHTGRASALGAASGIVAGLVGITPAAAYVEPWAAMIIGFGAGLICYGGVLLKGRLKYDDSLDVMGIHGVGGAWGAIATGIFATVGAVGLISGNFDQFLAQIIGVLAAAAYAAVITFIIVKVLDAIIGFRVEEEQEQIGLDQVEHGEAGYNF